MRRTKPKLCFGCNQSFTARAGAKTCSPRCRKRFQRAREIYREELVYDRPKYAPVAAESAGLKGRVYAGR